MRFIGREQFNLHPVFVPPASGDVGCAPEIAAPDSRGVMNFNYVPGNGRGPPSPTKSRCHVAAGSLQSLLLLACTRVAAGQQHIIAVESPGERLIAHFNSNEPN